jgi:hypothetical protein
MILGIEIRIPFDLWYRKRYDKVAWRNTQITEITVPIGLHNGRFGPTQQPTTKQTRSKLLIDILKVECRLCSVVDCRFAAVLQLEWPILVNMAQTRSNHPWRRQFRLNDGNFLTKKITLLGMDSSLVEYVANF